MNPIDKTKTYPKETHSRAIIRFQDCDPLKHLNNAKYFDYFFNAREDQVPQLYGLNFADVYKEFFGGWVIYQHQIAYVRPANVGEWVRIMSRLLFFDRDTIIVEYAMTDDQQKQFKTLLWSTMKFVDSRTGRSTAHPPLVNEYLEVMLLPGDIFTKQDFSERIKSLKKSLMEN